VKPVTFIVTLECRDDVPQHVIEWIGANLADHAAQEFGQDFEPDWVDPPYEDAPLDGGVTFAQAMPGALDLDAASELALGGPPPGIRW
jgi:hypothetical protein